MGPCSCAIAAGHNTHTKIATKIISDLPKDSESEQAARSLRTLNAARPIGASRELGSLVMRHELMLDRNVRLLFSAYQERLTVTQRCPVSTPVFHASFSLPQEAPELRPLACAAGGQHTAQGGAPAQPWEHGQTKQPARETGDSPSARTIYFHKYFSSNSISLARNSAMNSCLNDYFR